MAKIYFKTCPLLPRKFQNLFAHHLNIVSSAQGEKEDSKDGSIGDDKSEKESREKSDKDDKKKKKKVKLSCGCTKCSCQS